MPVTYSIYQHGESWLHRLDPRAKTVWLLCGFLFTITFNNPAFVIALFLVTLAMGLSARLDRSVLRGIVLAALFFVAFSAPMWALYVQQGTPLFEIGGVDITDVGLLFGLAAGLRVGTMIAIATLWMLTTSPQRITLGLTSSGLPQTAALVASMAIRFVPMVRGEMLTIAEAQRARALDLSTRNPLKKAQRYAPILVPLLSRLFGTAQQLALALDARGFGYPAARTTLYQLHMTRRDWTFLAAWVAIEVAALALRLAGYGTIVQGLL